MSPIAMAQYGSGAAITALLHPFGYAKILMQVGHEPLPPVPSTTFFFRRQTLINPNIFKYMGHIKQVDGFFGLYRGLFPRLLAGTVGNIVQYNILDRIKEKKDVKKKEEGKGEEEEEENLVPWLIAFAKETSEDSLGRCCGVIVSHPFHVIMVRTMVQFVGKETEYNSIFSSIREIYQQDGILGFFSGLIPRLIGEVLTIWLISFLTQTVHRYLIQDKRTRRGSNQSGVQWMGLAQWVSSGKIVKEMKTYTSAICGLVVSHFTYPFTLVTNIMAVNGSGLKGGQEPLMQIYGNWWQCMQSLSQEGELKRGASAFWRVYRSPLASPTIIPVKTSSRINKLR